MIQDKKIAVVVPAYRVALQIEGVIAQIPEFVDQIFVVDDASTDDSGSRVERLKNPRLTLIRHPRNQGVGGATVTGMKAAMEAGYDVLIKCDGDGQMDPADIPKLIAPLLDGSADYAKGSRFHHSQALRTMPKWRFVGNVGLTFLAKLASGYWSILDPTNGFLATRADVARKIPLERVSRGYFFETDLLIRLNVVEARVADVPLPARYGAEHSSLSIARVLLVFPARLMAGLARRVFWRYLFYDVSPVAIFGVLGVVLCGFGVVFGSYQWVKHATQGIATPTGTVMIAALPFILGFQLLLQAIVLDIQNTPRASGQNGSTANRSREDS